MIEKGCEICTGDSEPDVDTVVNITSDGPDIDVAEGVTKTVFILVIESRGDEASLY